MPLGLRNFMREYQHVKYLGTEQRFSKNSELNLIKPHHLHTLLHYLQTSLKSGSKTFTFATADVATSAIIYTLKFHRFNITREMHLAAALVYGRLGLFSLTAHHAKFLPGHNGILVERAYCVALEMGKVVDALTASFESGKLIGLAMSTRIGLLMATLNWNNKARIRHYLRLWNLHDQFKIIPDDLSLDYMSKAFCARGRIKEAEEILHKRMDSGVPVRVQVLNEFMMYYLQTTEDHNEITKIFQYITDYKISANQQSFAILMLSLLAQNSAPEVAFSVYISSRNACKEQRESELIKSTMSKIFTFNDNYKRMDQIIKKARAIPSRQLYATIMKNHAYQVWHTDETYDLAANVGIYRIVKADLFLDPDSIAIVDPQLEQAIEHLFQHYSTMERENDWEANPLFQKSYLHALSGISPSRALVRLKTIIAQGGTGYEFQIAALMQGMMRKEMYEKMAEVFTMVARPGDTSEKNHRTPTMYKTMLQGLLRKSITDKGFMEDLARFPLTPFMRELLLEYARNFDDERMYHNLYSDRIVTWIIHQIIPEIGARSGIPLDDHWMRVRRRKAIKSIRVNGIPENATLDLTHLMQDSMRKSN